MHREKLMELQVRWGLAVSVIKSLRLLKAKEELKKKMDGWDIHEDILRSPYPSKLKCLGHKGILSYKVIHKDVVFCKDIEQIIKMREFIQFQTFI